MLNTLNTLQVFCSKASQAQPFAKAMEAKGYELETVPAMSNKHVFHFNGRCHRSAASVVLPGANPYDIYALLAESEIGNPFLVWEPEVVKDIFTDLSKLHKIQYAGHELSPEQKEQHHRLSAALKAQRKPIIFYGSDKEWEPFMRTLDHLKAAGTLRPGFKESITRCSTPEEMQSVLEARVPKDLSGKSTADYRFHTYEPGPNPIIDIVAQDDVRQRPRASIAFFGSATTRQEKHLETAKRSVEMCERNGWGIVNGGGTSGVMGMQARTAKDKGVYLHGISAHERGAVGLTGAEKDPEAIKQLMPRYTDHKDMIHRIECYLEHSNGVCMVDGGIGSGEELFMVLELFRQKHKCTQYQDVSGAWHDQPFVVVDEHNTWGPVLQHAREVFGDDYMAPVKQVHSIEEGEAIFAKQFSKFKPKLPLEVVNRTVKEADGELRQVIKDLPPLAEPAYGRPKNIAQLQSTMSLVELTNLNPTASEEDIARLCHKAFLEEAASVCVLPEKLEMAKKFLPQGSKTKLTTVVNFPAGDSSTEHVKDQIHVAQAAGVDEVALVLPHALIKSGDYSRARSYIKEIIEAANGQTPVRAVLETADMSPKDIAVAALFARACGAASVQTSTGAHAKGGASVEAVEILRAAVGEGVSVKACGNVNDYEHAMAMVEAGADKIGTSGFSITSQQQRVPAVRMTDALHESLPGYAKRGAGG